MWTIHKTISAKRRKTLLAAFLLTAACGNPVVRLGSDILDTADSVETDGTASETGDTPDTASDSSPDADSDRPHVPWDTDTARPPWDSDSAHGPWDSEFPEDSDMFFDSELPTRDSDATRLRTAPPFTVPGLGDRSEPATQAVPDTDGGPVTSSPQNPHQ